MEAAAARPRDAWGATGGAVRAASRGLRPGLQPRFPRTRGARGLGATAHAEGSGPGAAFPGVAGPGGVPRARAALPPPRGLSWEAWARAGRPNLRQDTEGTASPRTRLQGPAAPWARPPAPRQSHELEAGAAADSACKFSLSPHFLRPVGTARLLGRTRAHTPLTGAVGTVWTVLKSGFSRAADVINTLCLQF